MSSGPSFASVPDSWDSLQPQIDDIITFANTKGDVWRQNIKSSLKAMKRKHQGDLYVGIGNQMRGIVSSLGSDLKLSEAVMKNVVPEATVEFYKPEPFPSFNSTLSLFASDRDSIEGDAEAFVTDLAQFPPAPEAYTEKEWVDHLMLVRLVTLVEIAKCFSVAYNEDDTNEEEDDEEDEDMESAAPPSKHTLSVLESTVGDIVAPMFQMSPLALGLALSLALLPSLFLTEPTNNVPMIIVGVVIASLYYGLGAHVQMSLCSKGPRPMPPVRSPEASPATSSSSASSSAPASSSQGPTKRQHAPSSSKRKAHK
jgi:hypothetical protein